MSLTPIDKLAITQMAHALPHKLVGTAQRFMANPTTPNARSFVANANTCCQLSQEQHEYILLMLEAYL